jgi:hypothetical protein
VLIPEKDAHLHLCPLRPSSSTCSSSDRAPCMGPKCAAWRGAAVIKFSAGGSAPEEIRAGFCGLAGVPPEVTSSQAAQLLAEVPALIAMISSAGETRQ